MDHHLLLVPRNDTSRTLPRTRRSGKTKEPAGHCFRLAGSSSFDSDLVSLLGVDVLHDPAIDVPQHVGVDAMSGRIGVHADGQASGVEQTMIATGHCQGND